MRIFMKQTNMIETAPAISKATGLPVETLAITFKVYDQTDTLIGPSSITLGHVAGGVYRGTVPELTALIHNEKFNVELEVRDGPTRIWYFKGPAKAIIRNQL